MSMLFALVTLILKSTAFVVLFLGPISTLSTVGAFSKSSSFLASNNHSSFFLMS
jgi:hypothetical protein